MYYSDSLVKDAFGGEAAAKLAFQSDEQGFKESEVDLPSVLLVSLFYFVLFYSMFLMMFELEFDTVTCVQFEFWAWQ